MQPYKHPLPTLESIEREHQILLKRMVIYGLIRVIPSVVLAVIVLLWWMVTRG